MRKTGRFGLILLVALLLAALCLSTGVTVLFAGHDCHGEDCRICACVMLCEDILRTALLSLCGVALCFALRAVLCCVLLCRKDGFFAHTLIDLKVKLSI